MVRAILSNLFFRCSVPYPRCQRLFLLVILFFLLCLVVLLGVGFLCLTFGAKMGTVAALLQALAAALLW